MGCSRHRVFTYSGSEQVLIKKPELTPSFCLHVVVSATPSPGRFQPAISDPSVMTLFDLGIVDAMSSAVFVQGVKARIFPWHLNDSDLLSAPGTTLQLSANSVQANAF